jgi:PII-like signaling protein
MSQQVCLRFYMHENRKLHGILMYEWLLEKAKKNGVHGGSAFRAIAGFGRHGHLHEQHFFELAGDLTVAVEFLLASDEGDAMLAWLRDEKISVFYTRTAVEFGLLDGNR